MNEDTDEIEGTQQVPEMATSRKVQQIIQPSSPKRVLQNVPAQGITLTALNPLTNSPKKITVIPTTVRNPPIRIIPAPNKGVLTPSSHITVPTSGQQRIFTIQTANTLQSGVSPVVASVSNTGQLLHYTTQNVVKPTGPKLHIQGRQLQYVHVLNTAKSATNATQSTSSPSTSAQLPSNLQMIVIPPPKHDVQLKNKSTTAAKLKPVQETPKEETKSVKQTVSLPPEVLLPRKPCNCTKSLCLKLYCECFANGEFCYMCKCVNCYNNLEHEEERQKAIKSCLDRNRDAFRPKIGKGVIGDGRRHNRGCQCKRSGCLKNYCECYEAKISCSEMCRCVGCKNSSMTYEEAEELSKDMEVKRLQNSLPKVGRPKVEQQPTKSLQNDSVALKKPRVFFTPHVIEATCQCMITRASDAQNHAADPSKIERIVLEEFGKCLVSIVDAARNFNENVSNGKVDSLT